MEPVQQWNGRAACTLQAALRLSNESFAEHLGIAARTVAMWHQKPDRVPQPDVQKMLDTALTRADEGAQIRFTNALPQCDTSAGIGQPDGGDSLAPGADLTNDPDSATISEEECGGFDGGSVGGWLHVAPSATAPPDGSNIGEILRWYRTREGLSQQSVAARLNTTQSRLSKLEKGTQVLRDVEELRRLARQLGIPPERLGVLPDRSSDANPLAAHVSDRPGPGRDSQERWRKVRRQLNAQRAMLGDLAAELYPRQERIPGTTVLTCADWLPDGPVDLSDITLTWRTTAPVPAITGKDPASACARPLMASGKRYDRYSRALRDLARPRLLDNRISYRLLDVDWTDNKGSVSFNYTTYFDVLDVGESLAHEFAQAWLNAGRKRPSFADLTFRRAIDDPFDLAARPMLPSINTLTIRHDPIEGHRMYLHRRDAKAVAAAGGMYHVVPAGVFQPAALAPAHQSNDFSLRRNVQREFSEEFLGNAEHDGNGIEPIAYGPTAASTHTARPLSRHRYDSDRSLTPTRNRTRPPRRRQRARQPRRSARAKRTSAPSGAPLPLRRRDLDRGVRRAGRARARALHATTAIGAAVVRRTTGRPVGADRTAVRRGADGREPPVLAVARRAHRRLDVGRSA